ncbi:MAG: hypothetical protein A2149_00190 [Candidatus Schekmanbacteria bacterium RBG_16_38_11]|uniref:Teneurin-like YD-shell domain-containing protein n=1 Tax=Candidatus Schekmanbacteria bacterium RBG_16_38_11 TaxID=1817880 RepID=A0A1F7RUY6_9BACT|nr:MAG: hypothetical protein A2149_00190 [Candidatus Schekmanbacteria bacterium RBG_16_38_11]
MITDENRNVVWQADYEPFGKIYQQSGTVKNNFRFPGQYYDSESGLYQNGFRDYDPKLGRYIEPDPIGQWGDVNLYAYVGNNPVNLIDPKGLYFAPWHSYLTYIAMRDSGHNITNSFYTALMSIWADRPSTQGLDAALANRHAMGGLLPEGVYQTRAEAIAGTENFINGTIQKATLMNLGEAMHAGQDKYACGHNYSEWRGFHFNRETYEHLKNDFFPSSTERWKSYVESLIIINKYKVNIKNTK